jgi:hypothetical protein
LKSRGEQTVLDTLQEQSHKSEGINTLWQYPCKQVVQDTMRESVIVDESKKIALV